MGSDSIKRKRKTKKNKQRRTQNHTAPKKQRKSNVKHSRVKKKSFGERVKQNRSLVIIWISVGCLILAAIGALIYIKLTYTITNIYVDGNTYYTDDEIIDKVMNGRFSDNSLFLSLKYRDKSIENVPFVEKMDVDIVNPDTVRITVYEKALAGYVAYLGRYMYFDREGTIVESSQEAINDVPEVMGLKFDHLVMYQKLPVDNTDVFAEILDITQLLGKYELKADRMFFDSSYDVFLYFGNVEVSIGTDDNIDEKIIQLQYILPSLEGKSGVLKLEEYNADTKNITFEEENTDSSAQTETNQAGTEQSGTEQTETDQAGTEQSGTEQTETDQAGTD